MNEQRPAWAWLFFPHLALVIIASVLATAGHFPVTWFQRSPLDKLGHLAAYGGLSFLGVAFFGRARRWPFVICLLVAATLEEVSQRAFPTRTFDLADLAMNVVGISVFGAVAIVKLAAPGRRSHPFLGADGCLLVDDAAGPRESPTLDRELRRQLLEEEELRRELFRAWRTLTFERAAIRPVLPALGPLEWGIGAFIFVFFASLILRCVNAL